MLSRRRGHTGVGAASSQGLGRSVMAGQRSVVMPVQGPPRGLVGAVPRPGPSCLGTAYLAAPKSDLGPPELWGNKFLWPKAPGLCQFALVGLAH